MWRTVTLAVRRKWGQRAWSPTATTSGAAPANGISAQEALQIAYRPMPPSETVEYEEDFGHNLMIHREYISKRCRDRVSFEISALSYSETELHRGKQHLAGIMNRERRGVSVGASGAPDDQVSMETDVDPNTREVLSARYLFNEKRLQFCDRFQTFFQSRLEGETGDPARNGDTQYLFSLMEACAVIYGCETDAARETYYRMFLQLDLDTLEEEEEALRNRIAEAKLVQQILQNKEGDAGALSTTGSSPQLRHGLPDAPRTFPVSALRTAADEESLIASIPELSLFGDDEKHDDSDGVDGGTSSSDGETDGGVGTSYSTSPLNQDPLSSSPAIDLPSEFEEYAPLYKAYIAHANGQSSVASYDVSTLGSTGLTAERRRWRDLMEKIVREDYHTMTEVEQMDAVVLNGQLHTIKFFDLKVGDAVREIFQLLQREVGGSSSVNRDTPVGMSPNHPERRV